jgi:hypothetical protein
LLLAASIAASGTESLVVLSYDGRHELEDLAALGLHILHYQKDVLAAISTESEIALLERAGFRPVVLAPIDRRREVYLVYPGAEDGRSASVEGFDNHPYGPDTLIAQLDADEADALARHGADIVRLQEAIRVPSRPTAAACSAPLGSSPPIQSMLRAISPTLLIHHVCKLQDRDELGYCNELGTRYSFATAELGEAAEYIYAAYDSYGLDVSYDPFLFNSKPMTNVVAELPGTGSCRDQVLIVCAHYDSISPQPLAAAPGADDNASGVAAVLEVARILSQQTFPCTIRFVNFAGEEQGLIGSAHYAEQAAQRGDTLRGVINLDMIAYESVPPNDHRVDLHAGTDPLSIAVADVLVASISDFGLELVPQVITAGATWRSDHASFWGRGFPAVLAIEDMDDLNPHYHSERDTLSGIRQQLLTEFSKATLATLVRLAGQSHEPSETPTPMPTTTPAPTVPPAPPAPTRLYLHLFYRAAR